MADNSADTAQIFASGLLQGVEGRLQNCRGEGDIVYKRIVAGVYHVAGHCPVFGLGVLVKLAQGILFTNCLKRKNYIKERIFGVKRKLIVYSSYLVGITHLNTHCGKLENSFFSGLFTQNFVCLDTGLVGVDNLKNYLGNILLRLFAEVFYTVVNSHGFGIHTGSKVVCKLFNILHLCNAHKRTAVCTAQLAKLFGQEVAGSHKTGYVCPVFVFFKVFFVEQGCKSAKVSGLGNNHSFGHVTEKIGKDHAEIKGRKHFSHLACVHGVVHFNVSGPFFAGLCKRTDNFVKEKRIVYVLFLLFGGKVCLRHNRLCNVCPYTDNLRLLSRHFGLVVGCIGQNYACALNVYKAAFCVFHIRINTDVDRGGNTL